MTDTGWGYRLYPKGKGKLVRRLLPTAREILVRSSVSSLNLADYRTVLVAGAGMDPYRRLFQGAEQYISFDIDDSYGGIDVRADAHSLPFADETCDCIFATEIMEHLDSPQRFIDEAYRVLRPGGAVIATVPFMFHQHANPNDFIRPTKEVLKKWFSRYDETNVSAQGNRLHSISDLISTAFSGRSYIQAPFVFFRVFNHLLAVLDKLMDSELSTAPTGYLIVARKHGSGTDSRTS